MQRRKGRGGWLGRSRMFMVLYLASYKRIGGRPAIQLDHLTSTGWSGRISRVLPDIVSGVTSLVLLADC